MIIIAIIYGIIEDLIHPQIKDTYGTITEDFVAEVLSNKSFTELSHSGTQQFIYTPKINFESPKIAQNLTGHWEIIDHGYNYENLELCFYVTREGTRQTTGKLYVLLKNQDHLDQVRREIDRLTEKRKKRLNWFPYRMVIPPRLDWRMKYSNQ